MASSTSRPPSGGKGFHAENMPIEVIFFRRVVEDADPCEIGALAKVCFIPQLLR